MVGKCVWSAFLGCSSPCRHVVVLCVTIQKLPSGSLPEHCERSVAIRPVSAGNAAQGWSAFPQLVAVSTPSVFFVLEVYGLV